MKLKLLCILSFLVFFLMAGNALAVPVDITIFDQMSSGTGWWGQQENNEVEPGCVGGQQWDLEGFYLDQDTAMLYMVGGYNFKEGEDDPYRPGNHYDSGDLFFDMDGDAQFGPSNTSEAGGSNIVANTFGYEYAMDFDFDSLTYVLWDLTMGTEEAPVFTQTAYFDQNQESNPWQHVAGGTIVDSDYFSYFTPALEEDYESMLADLGYSDSDDHYIVAINLPTDLLGFTTSHFTMDCGNDNLMGQQNPVPEPATMLLFGSGLIGLAVVGRRKMSKA